MLRLAATALGFSCFTAAPLPVGAVLPTPGSSSGSVAPRRGGSVSICDGDGRDYGEDNWAGAMVAGRSELVSLIMRHLGSMDIARMEAANKMFRSEGRAHRLARIDVPFLKLGATRTQSSWGTGHTRRYYVSVPMSVAKCRKYASRDSLLQMLKKKRTLWSHLHTVEFKVRESIFFKDVEYAKRGLQKFLATPAAFKAQRPGDALSALKELEHFETSLRRDLATLKSTHGRPETRHARTECAKRVLEAFMKHASTLSYGLLFMVCYFARLLK